MADIVSTTEEKTSESTVLSMPYALFGRRDIFASAESLTAENIIYEVNTALEYHYANVMEEDFLYWYRRGLTPVLNRTKEYNDWILNKVNVPVAGEICDFKNGYFLMERPGSFYHIGAGCSLPLHNTAFLPGEQAPVFAAAIHAAVIQKYLMNA